jgi:lipopolysaccharide/colanic/teichoic acid biosynthesis glycosyltransferase
MLKRLFDIIVAGIITLVFLPFGLIIALILRLTGEGEVFYRQKRIGRHGEPFGLFKFTTMRKNSEFTGAGEITLKGDPRVLPVGRVLRKTKLNEVPQILNVLIGDMSLVGPRPLTPGTFAHYPEDIQREIVTMQPGVTGIGSIVFRDEESIIDQSEKDYERCYREDIAPYKGRLELWYKEHRSFALDLKLLALTVVVVLAPDSDIVSRAFKDLPAR